jgi:hypothetical protein
MIVRRFLIRSAMAAAAAAYGTPLRSSSSSCSSLFFSFFHQLGFSYSLFIIIVVEKLFLKIKKK